jgi:hypothetical protein
VLSNAGTRQFWPTRHISPISRNSGKSGTSCTSCRDCNVLPASTSLPRPNGMSHHLHEDVGFFARRLSIDTERRDSGSRTLVPTCVDLRPCGDSKPCRSRCRVVLAAPFYTIETSRHLCRLGRKEHQQTAGTNSRNSSCRPCYLGDGLH